MSLVDSCSVVVDGEIISSTDFMAILSSEEGDVKAYFNTDAISMGLGLKLMARSFVEMLEQVEEEDRVELVSILKGVPIFDDEEARYETD